MARHIWVISPSSSAVGRQNEEDAAAKPTEGGRTIGRRLDRLRPKAKKHEPVKPLAPKLVALSEEGMHAAPDDPPRTRRSGDR